MPIRQGDYTVLRLTRRLSIVVHLACYHRPGPIIAIDKLRHPGEYAITLGSVFVVVSWTPKRTIRQP